MNRQLYSCGKNSGVGRSKLLSALINPQNGFIWGRKGLRCHQNGGDGLNPVPAPSSVCLRIYSVCVSISLMTILLMKGVYSVKPSQNEGKYKLLETLHPFINIVSPLKSVLLDTSL